MYFPTVSKITNKLYAILKKWGNIGIKRFLWDREFSSGKWNYIEHTIDDIIYHYIEKYSNNGDILDLGCGSGNTGNEININKYRHYTGVDVSMQAIQKARVISKQNYRNKKNKYLFSDISVYIPEKQYDLILFRESIYYVAGNRIKGMIDRYSNYLKRNGVLIVKIWNREKYNRIVKLIEKNYNIIEKYLAKNSKGIIIVFKSGS